ncbi:MAG: hypothetical protein HC916_07840 [Coleofasciculaceae cyanobacterium SM2_1_6]|nr:hypothetical protein [Coleofasciculaceae cyanobacterium SM2_1_6]
MNNHIITKTGESQFNLTWENVPDSTINLDFRPLQKVFKLTGVYCLLHWQAKPKGLRRFGVYESLNDNYLSVDSADLLIAPYLKTGVLQIDEKVHTTLPTAVMLYEKCYLRQIEEKWLIGGGS